VAYEAKRGKKWLVVVDGEESKEYDEIWRLRFSPDSKRVAYVAVRGGKMLVVVDREEGKECDRFWPGSEWVFDGPTVLHFPARRGDDILRVEVEIVEE
jgi:hypothetical protein